MMAGLRGFPEAKSVTGIPDPFFRELLRDRPPGRLKVTLYAFWRLDHMEGLSVIYVAYFMEDKRFMGHGQ
jgi:hypothetical protein